MFPVLEEEGWGSAASQPQGAHVGTQSHGEGGGRRDGVGEPQVTGSGREQVEVLSTPKPTLTAVSGRLPFSSSWDLASSVQGV